MRMSNVMLDLETISTLSNAVIMSIGATFFDEENIGEKFHMLPDRDQQQTIGRHVSPDTIKWWANQSAEARKIFDEPQTGMIEVLESFSDYLGDGNVNIWGNGADFDNVILGSLFADAGVKRPWSYSRNRCFRTIKNLVVRDRGSVMPEREGVHHDALDDAVFQAKCLQVLIKGKLRLE